MAFLAVKISNQDVSGLAQGTPLHRIGHYFSNNEASPYSKMSSWLVNKRHITIKLQLFAKSDTHRVFFLIKEKI